MALYRKYRSKSLDDIVGQTHITNILRAQIAAGRISHAYLLTGPRGVGKTSIARILAHEINSLPYTDDSSHLDIIEIDAASNNGVEDVRDLRERVQIAPSQAAYKVYIIDEVHMLSRQAFNALLKTLEEPPAHVVFILATTDVDKLPATIISRVQRYNFRAISRDSATRHLRQIADSESITIDDEALDLIAEHGRGSFRDSISLLDQLQHLAAPDTSITRAMVAESLGLADHETVSQLLDAYLGSDRHEIVRLLADHQSSGANSAILVEQLIAAIQPRLTDQPALLPLLDRLLEVLRSSRPHLKLLTTLTLPLIDLPSRATPPQEAPTVQSAPSDIKSATKKSTKTESKKSAKKSEQAVKPATASDKTTASTNDEPVDPAVSRDFDWQRLLDTARAKSVALYGTLHKAEHTYDGATLRIYAGNSFNAKKLEETKYRPKLMEALSEIGHPEAEIDITPDKKPPEDSQAAAIIAMMGGGEQVNVS